MFWRIIPAIFGPLLGPIDRLLLALPLVGPAMRQNNSDRMAGWLGFAASDVSSQRAALEAARAWYRGDLLSRECAAVLRDASAGNALSTCLARARGFDEAFHAAVSISDGQESLAALRARWRVAGTLPENSSAVASALVQIVLGIMVAAVVVAMYLPMFQMASLL
jgi:type II secretory pathway component PulF